MKKNEQMHALVAIALALCPAAQRQLDENVFNTLRDKCALSGKHCFMLAGMGLASG